MQFKEEIKTVCALPYFEDCRQERDYIDKASSKKVLSVYMAWILRPVW